MKLRLPVIPKSVLGYLNTLILIFALVVIFLFFCSKKASFGSIDNIQLLARQGTIVCVAALGMTYIIILGGIDLSVGSVMAFVAVVVAWSLKKHYSPIEAAGIGILAGVLCGFVNGLLITRLKVVPFIVTLGTYLVVRGAAKGLAKEQKIDADITWLNGLLEKILIKDSTALAHRALVLGCAIAGLLLCIVIFKFLVKKFVRNETDALLIRRVFTVVFVGVGLVLAWPLVGLISLVFPKGVWLLVALAVMIALALKYTRFGRHVVAVGSNEQAARLCGIPVDRVKLLVYTLGGFCGGVSGLLLFSRLSVGDPTAAVGQELDVIAAVVIGGASLSGGEGSIIGSLIGAIIMVTLKAGGTQLGWDNWMQEIITGCIIIASVALDRLRTRRES